MAAGQVTHEAVNGILRQYGGDFADAYRQLSAAVA